MILIFDDIVISFYLCVDVKIVFLTLKHEIRSQNHEDYLLCPSSEILNNYKTRRFGNWICFLLQLTSDLVPATICPQLRIIAILLQIFLSSAFYLA
jgi:hypothetical protein